MIGRSSRARGSCLGTLFALTSDAPEQLMLKLKSSNATELEELRNLIKVVFSKRAQVSVMEAIQLAQEKEGSIRMLKELEGYMGKPKFSKLMRGFEF